MKHFVCFLLIILLGSAYIHGEEDYTGIYSKSGKTFFPFLKMGYDARSIAMSDASIGMPSDIYGVLSNPASLGYINQKKAMISYKPVILDIRGGALGFAWPQNSVGVFTGNIIYLSYGTFDNLLDENNKEIEGALYPYSVAGYISWSKILISSLSLGFTVKGMYDKLSDGISDEIYKSSADGFAVDIGIQYRTQSARLIYGFLVQNIGFIRSSYSEDTEKGRLPLSVASGISYIFKNFPSVRVAFDLEKAIDDFLEYQIGLELNAYKQILFIRGGFSFSQSDLEELINIIKSEANEDYQKTNWSLFSLGTGINADVSDIDISVDLAFNFRVNGLDPAFALSFLVGF